MTRWEYATTSDLYPCKAAGVYLIYIDDVPVYVGYSMNVYKRLLSTHWRTCGMEGDCYPFTFTFAFGRFVAQHGIHFKWKPDTKYGEGAMTELRLIRKLQPSGNRIGKGGVS